MCGYTDEVHTKFESHNDSVERAAVLGICEKCQTGKLWYHHKSGGWYADGYGNELIGTQKLDDETYMAVFGEYVKRFGEWEPQSLSSKEVVQQAQKMKELAAA